jgi:nitrate reductase gamma subunit
MELLEFARGPALQISITIFVFGIAFRVFSLFLMWRTSDSSAGSSREKPVVVAAIREIILFFKDLFGFSWPALPNNVIYAVAVITVGSMIAALAMRFANPAQKIISTFDDWFSWLVTFLPVITGLVATSHMGARYETLLGLHILSISLLLIWIPFGKLMHFFLVFVTRAQTGAHLSHRGAQL